MTEFVTQRSDWNDGRGDCPAKSPVTQWLCCLPAGHDGNHIGTTADYGKLCQWAPADVAAATS